MFQSICVTLAHGIFVYACWEWARWWGVVAYALACALSVIGVLGQRSLDAGNAKKLASYLQ